jgi:hypothetical protein
LLAPDLVSEVGQVFTVDHDGRSRLDDTGVPQAFNALPYFPAGNSSEIDSAVTSPSPII